MKTITLLTATLALLLALPALADDPLFTGKVGTQSDDQSTIYLGEVAVGGQKEIYEAMQDIKLALDQPISTDPKLADVVVCRITDDIGTHAKQLLICATNKVLNQNKEILETVMSNSLGNTNSPLGGDGHGGSPTTCNSASCFEDTLSILNQSLNNTRRHYMKQQVNGATLHALLAKIPYPKQVQAVPASATVPAPAAATSHL